MEAELVSLLSQADRVIGRLDMLVAARQRYIQNTKWGSRCYLDPKRFAEAAAEQHDDLVY